MLGEASLADIALTAPANAAPAAYGIDIDAKLPGRLQHGCALAHLAAFAGRRKDDEGGLEWECSSWLEDKYLPKVCQGIEPPDIAGETNTWRRGPMEHVAAR